MAEEQAIPGEVDPPARRRFLEWAIGLLMALVTIVIAWPLIAALIGPMYRRVIAHYSKAGSVDAIAAGPPVKLEFSYVTEDGYLREMQTREVWVIKHSASDLTVFSPICTHLSCRFNWHPQSQQFVCPCHGSVFSITGKVLAGPAPRPLDTLPYRIEDGQLYVEWQVYEPGIAAKVPI